MGRWWFRDLCGDLAGDVGQSFSSILASWKLHEEAQKLMDYVLHLKEDERYIQYTCYYILYLFFVNLSLLSSMCLVLGDQCWGICHGGNPLEAQVGGSHLQDDEHLWQCHASPCLASSRIASRKKCRRRVCCLQMLGRGVRMFTRPTRCHAC